jgi:hypothetical protein
VIAEIRALPPTAHLRFKDAITMNDRSTSFDLSVPLEDWPDWLRSGLFGHLSSPQAPPQAASDQYRDQSNQTWMNSVVPSVTRGGIEGRRTV